MAPASDPTPSPSSLAASPAASDLAIDHPAFRGGVSERDPEALAARVPTGVAVIVGFTSLVMMDDARLSERVAGRSESVVWIPGDRPVRVAATGTSLVGTDGPTVRLSDVDHAIAGKLGGTAVAPLPPGPGPPPGGIERPA
jgi:hypothetical protein